MKIHKSKFVLFIGVLLKLWNPLIADTTIIREKITGSIPTFPKVTDKNDYFYKFYEDLPGGYFVGTIPQRLNSSLKYPVILDMSGKHGKDYVDKNFIKRVEGIAKAGQASIIVCPINSSPDLHTAFINHLKASGLPIDEERIYITGGSKAGRATYAAVQANPELYAVAVPGSAAYVNPDDFANLPLNSVPIHPLHSRWDPTVELIRLDTRMGPSDLAIVEAMRYAGHSRAKLSILPLDTHNGSIFTFKALDWMFKHGRNLDYEITYLAPPQMTYGSIAIDGETSENEWEEATNYQDADNDSLGRDNNYEISRVALANNEKYLYIAISLKGNGDDAMRLALYLDNDGIASGREIPKQFDMNKNVAKLFFGPSPINRTTKPDHEPWRTPYVLGDDHKVDSMIAFSASDGVVGVALAVNNDRLRVNNTINPAFDTKYYQAFDWVKEYTPSKTSDYYKTTSPMVLYKQKGIVEIKVPLISLNLSEGDNVTFRVCMLKENNGAYNTVDTAPVKSGETSSSERPRLMLKANDAGARYTIKGKQS